MTRLFFLPGGVPIPARVTVDSLNIRNLKVWKDVGRINVPTTSKPSVGSSLGLRR